MEHDLQDVSFLRHLLMMLNGICFIRIVKHICFHVFLRDLECHPLKQWRLRFLC